METGCWQERLEVSNNKPMVLVVACAIFDRDGRILLAQRPKGKSMAGLWEFPGGKIEKQENPETALVRELKEELSIDTHQSCLSPFTFVSHVYDDFHLVMFLYLCRVWQGHPRGVEGQDLKWVRIENLGSDDMPPADKPLVAMLRDFL